MLDTLLQIAKPTDATTVLDVGVTKDPREECNFFEKLYPYPHNITAVAKEDASFLAQELPGLTFVMADGCRLPFPDKSFELAVSFATLEHVGSRSKQGQFVHELCRVGKTVCITMPNRWYPVEFHTLLPFVYWLPPAALRFIVTLTGKKFMAQEENLNLLSESEAYRLFPPVSEMVVKYFRLLGFKSNVLFYAVT